MQEKVKGRQSSWFCFLVLVAECPGSYDGDLYAVCQFSVFQNVNVCKGTAVILENFQKASEVLFEKFLKDVTPNSFTKQLNL